MPRRPLISRRHSVLLLLLLAAGAILTIAVAWGGLLLPAVLLDRWPNAGDRVEGSATAADVRWLRRAFPNQRFPDEGCRAMNSVRALGWSQRDVRYVVAEDPHIAAWYAVTRFTAGLPWRSFAGEQHWDTMTATQSGTIAVPPLLLRWQGATPWCTLLPARPIWPGFALNTIFYAALLGLIVAACAGMRRRRRVRRGLCPACAYPIGASDVCSECGRAVEPRGI